MKTVLITGAARRGGAAIARRIHARGLRVILHCRASSLTEARQLADALNALRAESALVWSQELNDAIPAPPQMSSICGIVASASSYADSSLDSFEQHIESDMQTHVLGHIRLIQLCKQALISNQGSVVAITDIHVERASRGYLSYQIAKGALASAVRALAVELAPRVRVNAVAPGPFEWPTATAVSEQRKAQILQSTPLGRIGNFDELAAAVEFLLLDATYTTGSTLNVDGGRASFLE
jgi:pteridine reductase